MAHTMAHEAPELVERWAYSWMLVVDGRQISIARVNTVGVFAGPCTIRTNKHGDILYYSTPDTLYTYALYSDGPAWMISADPL